MSGQGYAVSELLRGVERTIMIGTVAELDPATARCRVDLGGEARSAWLPFIQLGSKDVRIWAPPVVGSQVLVLSPGGETARGVVLPGPYDGSAPDDRSSSVRLTMQGVDLQINGGELELVLTTAEITGTVNIIGPVNVSSGSVTVTGGDVVADGVSLKSHVHSGVTPGSANTGPPA